MNYAEGTRGVIPTLNWAVEYDGHSILEFMMVKSNCSYEHAKMVIEGEGGSIDSDGIIHKGTAVNKIGYID